MKTILTLLVVLAVASARAQTTSQSQIRHVETSMNHLTVLEFGEPVTTLAIGDADSFQIERHEDRVFIKPLQQGVSTNLFVWTSSRELNYELDPAGSLATMDVLIRTESAPNPHAKEQASAEISDQEIRKIAALVLAQTLSGAEDIAHDAQKQANGRVQIDLEQVYRAKDQLYIRYSVTNRTATPFRVTTPDVYAPQQSKPGSSLVTLRNHQLKHKTFESFEARHGVALSVLQAESAARDLAPGEKTTGVISIRSSQENSPQLYQLSFGTDQNRPVTAEVVL